MDHKEKQHSKDLEKHLGYDEMKLRKEASKLRRRPDAGKQRAEVDEDNWEEVLDSGKARRPRRESLNEVMERIRVARESGPGASTVEGVLEGRVLSMAGGGCRVFVTATSDSAAAAQGQDIDCRLAESLRGQVKLVVGDRVHVINRGGTPEVVGWLPRTTTLSRIDPSNRHTMRLIVANIDIVGHVIAARTLPEKVALIDRVLIGTQIGGAKPLLCVNKADTVSDEDRAQIDAILALYAPLELEIVHCSAVTGQGIDELFDRLRGQTSALVGHSGVGKSSLLNALDGRLALRTAEVRNSGTGRHTTTSSTLYDLGQETYVIDTPGVREFGLASLDRDALLMFFPELEGIICHFRDCSHTHEPKCGVAAEVEEGNIAPARYAMYKRLYAEIQ